LQHKNSVQCGKIRTNNSTFSLIIRTQS